MNQAETPHKSVYEIGPKRPAPTMPKRLMEIGPKRHGPKRPDRTGIGQKWPGFRYPLTYLGRNDITTSTPYTRWGSTRMDKLFTM